MADASVGLGLDLTSFTASLKDAQEALGKGAARALAQAKVAAIEASREQTRFAREQLRAQQEAGKAAAESARENARLAREAARQAERDAAAQIEAARKLAEEERRVGEARAAAALKLQGLAAGRSEVEKLTFAYKQQVAEIQRLAEVSGDNATAATALAAATKKHQAALAGLKTGEVTSATQELTGALEQNRGQLWKTQQAGDMFKRNVKDIAFGLLSGGDAVQVFSQQLPDLIQSVTDAGGVSNAAKAGFSGFASALSAAAPAIAIVSVAAASLATAFVTLKNQTESANPALYDAERAADAAGAAFERAKKETVFFASALQSVRDSAREQADAYGVLIGTVEEIDVSEREALKTAEQRNREAVRGIALQLESAKAAKQALDVQIQQAGRTTAITAETKELFKRRDAINAQIPALEAQTAAIKGEFAAAQDSIRASAEYSRELKKSNQFLADREKASQAAAEAARRQAESEKMVEERLKAINALLREQADLNQATIAWRRELEAAQVVAADLARAGVELQNLAITLEQAGQALEAEQALDFQRALAESYKTAEALRGVITLTVKSGLEAAVKAAYKFSQAFAGPEFDRITGLFTNPGQSLALLSKGLTDAQSQAAQSVSEAQAAMREALKEGDREAIKEAADNLKTAKKELDKATPKGFVKEMIKGARDTIQALVDDAPRIIRQLVKQVPKLISAIVAAIPELIRVLVRSLPTIAAELAVAFAIQLPIAIIAELPAIVRALALGVGEAFLAAGRAIKRVFKDIFKEISTGGRADTRTFNDTPGPTRLKRATTATFAAGDMVVAARTKEGLRAQVGARTDPAYQSGSVVALDLRYGPMALGLAYAHASMNQRSSVGRDTTGRRSPWGGR